MFTVLRSSFHSPTLLRQAQDRLFAYTQANAQGGQKVNRSSFTYFCFYKLFLFISIYFYFNVFYSLFVLRLLLFVKFYLSISGITKSNEPLIATKSAILFPEAILFIINKFEKLGVLNFILKGVLLPSLII